MHHYRDEESDKIVAQQRRRGQKHTGCGSLHFACANGECDELAVVMMVLEQEAKGGIAISVQR